MTASLVTGAAAGVVMAGENAAPLQPSRGKAAKTPRQPFAEVATLVNARADKKADNVVTGKMPENPPASGGQRLVPTSGISARTVVARPPTTETGKTTPCARGTSGLTRAIPSATETRKTPPRDPTGEAPALDTLMQARCEAAVCSTPAQSAKGPSKVMMTNPTALEGKEEIPDAPSKKRRLPNGMPAGDGANADLPGRGTVSQHAPTGHAPTGAVSAGGQSLRTPGTVQAETGPGVLQQTMLPVNPEKPVLSAGAVVPTGKPASLVPQMSDKHGPHHEAIPLEAVTPSRKDGSVMGAPVPAKQGTIEAKPVNGRIPSGPTLESKALQAQTPMKDSQLGAEQTRDVNPPAVQARNGPALIEPQYVSSPRPGDVQGRQAASSFDKPRQTRPAGETSVSPVGAKAANPLQADANAVSQAPMMVVESGRSMVAPEPASPDAPAPAGAFEGPVGRGSTASVGEQILDSVHASLNRGEQQLVVRLRPPELGSVIVRFGQNDDGVHGVLEVGRDDTRRQIEQALPQMLRSLNELGIQVKRLEVTVAEQPENDLGRGPSQQGTWTGQQGADPHTDQPQRSFDPGWAPRPNDGDGIERHEAVPGPTNMPAGRIDMLA